MLLKTKKKVSKTKTNKKGVKSKKNMRGGSSSFRDALKVTSIPFRVSGPGRGRGSRAPAPAQTQPIKHPLTFSEANAVAKNVYLKNRPPSSQPNYSKQAL